MQRTMIESLQQAIQAAREAARKGLPECDATDIDELIVPIERELKTPKPNPQTLATFLNSLLRSLHVDPGARPICEQLDTAMRAAHIPSEWERREPSRPLRE